MTATLQELPSVDQMLDTPAAARLLEQYNRDSVVDAVREKIRQARDRLLHTGEECERIELVARLEVDLRQWGQAEALPSLCRVINGTGIILHTGLGRAPLPAAALDAAAAAAANYCNLEVEMESGKRGSRLTHVDTLICAMTGAEAAAVVNNNAAAVLLMLSSLARGRKVLVSRGELVEIGGSFRIPDIIESSGARIHEVGTTNRTHLRDYASAVDGETAMILAVHPSNYRVQGFTARPELAELAGLGRERGIPVVYDLGGGVLEDLARWRLPHEPVVRETLRSGVDLVSFSGDKVLGGPQSGIVAGRRTYLERICGNPLMRALRCDKLTLAALEATLRLYRLGSDQLREALPVLRMLTDPVEAVEGRAREVIERVAASTRERLHPQVESATAQAGSGALPLEELPTWVIALQPARSSGEKLARRLRRQSPGVMGRIHQDRLMLDMRTVSNDEIGLVAAALDRVAETEG